MPNIQGRFPKREKWAEFSERLCKYYKLPHGSKFVLRRADGRQVRDDFFIQRRRLKKDEHKRCDDMTVAEVIERVTSMLATKKFRIFAIGPDKNRIDGHTHWKSWRDESAILTREQRAEERLRREEIDSLKPCARLLIADLEEGLEDPENKVSTVVITELLARYDLNSVREAIQELRIFP